jgi:hypothetical protein
MQRSSLRLARAEFPDHEDGAVSARAAAARETTASSQMRQRARTRRQPDQVRSDAVLAYSGVAVSVGLRTVADRRRRQAARSRFQGLGLGRFAATQPTDQAGPTGLVGTSDQGPIWRTVKRSGWGVERTATWSPGLPRPRRPGAGTTNAPKEPRDRDCSRARTRKYRRARGRRRPSNQRVALRDCRSRPRRVKGCCASSPAALRRNWRHVSGSQGETPSPREPRRCRADV